MKILVVADIYGDFQKLDTLLDVAMKEKPDLIISPGNFTDMFKIPPEFSQIDVADIVLQKLVATRTPLLCVPGNHDPYEILDLFDDYKSNLHNKHTDNNNTHFIGFGGAPTPFNTTFEPTEEETAGSLNTLANTLQDTFVLVVHNPPKDTKIDALKTGEHVGSKAIRDFILAKKPILAISAHIHEAYGEDMLGDTVLFNPGPVTQGMYGIITIEGKNITCTQHKI